MFICIIMAFVTDAIGACVGMDVECPAFEARDVCYEDGPDALASSAGGLSRKLSTDNPVHTGVVWKNWPGKHRAEVPGERVCSRKSTASAEARFNVLYCRFLL